MPLQRLDSHFEAIDGVGVSFTMVDPEKSGNPVACRVTFEALQDRARLDQEGRDWFGTWERHTKTIEHQVSANYDSKKPLKDGFVVVDTFELTPKPADQHYYLRR